MGSSEGYHVGALLQDSVAWRKPRPALRQPQCLLICKVCACAAVRQLLWGQGRALQRRQPLRWPGCPCVSRRAGSPHSCLSRKQEHRAARQAAARQHRRQC